MHFLLIEHSGLSWRSCQEKRNNLSQQEMYNLTEHLLDSTVKNKVGLVQLFFMLQTLWHRHPHAVNTFQTCWQQTNLVVPGSLCSWLSYHNDKKVKIFLDRSGDAQKPELQFWSMNCSPSQNPTPNLRVISQDCMPQKQPVTSIHEAVWQLKPSNFYSGICSLSP